MRQEQHDEVGAALEALRRSRAPPARSTWRFTRLGVARERLRALSVATAPRRPRGRRRAAPSRPPRSRGRPAAARRRSGRADAAHRRRATTCSAKSQCSESPASSTVRRSVSSPQRPRAARRAQRVRELGGLRGELRAAARPSGRRGSARTRSSSLRLALVALERVAQRRHDVLDRAAGDRPNRRSRRPGARGSARRPARGSPRCCARSASAASAWKRLLERATPAQAERDERREQSDAGHAAEPQQGRSAARPAVRATPRASVRERSPCEASASCTGTREHRTAAVTDPVTARPARSEGQCPARVPVGAVGSRIDQGILLDVRPVGRVASPGPDRTRPPMVEPLSSRDKILDVAEALFARRGYTGVGLRELARRRRARRSRRSSTTSAARPSSTARCSRGCSTRIERARRAGAAQSATAPASGSSAGSAR